MCNICLQGINNRINSALSGDTANPSNFGSPFAANGVEFNTRTGDANIDGLLIGTRWAGTSLTYAFPTSSDYFTLPYDTGANEIDNTYVNNFVAANPAWQTAFTIMLQDYSSVSNLSFTLVSSTTQADVVLALTTTANLETADGRFPTYTNEGHQWYQQSNYDVTPVLGSYTWATLLHETGHTMGLAHGHSADSITSVAGVVMNANRDSMEFSVMTYRSHVGGSFEGSYTNEDFGYAQSLMIYDIAAIQFMYGADFTYRSGNNVYSFSTTTGEMFVDGVGQGTPGANRIFRTVWDGNGVDTFNLSNYTSNLVVDLTPGGWSTFSNTQLANLNVDSNVIARGNLFNALLFNDDSRSLIENVIGGNGNDNILGNRAANSLQGGLGNDNLVGAGGSDILTGEDGNDTLWGDSAGSGAGIGFGSGLYSHGSIHDGQASAYNLTNTFSLVNNANIANSTTVAHTTMRYSSSVGDFAQYYRLDLASGQTITLDIDATSGLDSGVRILNSLGSQLDFNDDGGTDPGSSGTLDSNLTYTATAAGTYYFVVSIYNQLSQLPAASSYDLHVSVTNTGTSSEGVGAGDLLYGLAGADRLNGGDGSDNLWGGSSGDVHSGGDGVDFARYDEGNYGNLTISLLNPASNTGAALGDTYSSIEGLVGGVGNDLVIGDGLANHLFGGGGVDLVYGLAGVDYLNGGAGGDNLFGGLNSDVHVGGDDTGVDLARYDDGNYGNLTIRLDASSANIGAAAVGDTYFGIEGLVGGLGNDVVIGNTANNTLFGGGGSDYIDGRLGIDFLNGGGGADRFVFATAPNSTTNFDVVTDFVHGLDDLALARSIFAAIGTVLDTAELRFGSAAVDSNDFVIYNSATGQLFYDANGSGIGGQTQFARVTAGTVLDTGDFVMV